MCIHNDRSSYLLFLLAALFLIPGCFQSPDTQGGSSHDTHDTKESDRSNPFEEIAEAYESAERVIWQKPELIIDRMGNLQGRTVADIGAGTGYFAFRVADRGASVIAIDIDPRAIEWMDREKQTYSEEIRKRFETRLAAEDDARLSRGEADIVLMVNTYAYIGDRIAYFSKLKRGILPGGDLFIVDFKKTDTPIGPPAGERVSADTVVSELRQAGYDILSSDTTTLQYQYIITATPGFSF